MSVQAANNFGDNLAQGQAGPLGLVIIIALFIACFFLYRSMSKHMKRLPPTFDPPDDVDAGPERNETTELDPDVEGVTAGEPGHEQSETDARR